MCECQFRELLINDPLALSFINSLNFVGKYARFVGNSVIRYYDVCALYAYISKHGVFPIRYPKILLDESNFPSYFDTIAGFAKVDILRPKMLRFPALLVKYDNKLVFGLRRSCITMSCIEDRVIKGTSVCHEILYYLLFYIIKNIISEDTRFFIGIF